MVSGLRKMQNMSPLRYICFIAAISYFYATEKNTRAYILIYGEAILLAVLLFIIPRIVGIMGTWISIMLSQILVAVMSQLLLKIRK